MAIKIAHASISENGSVKNGVAGDQTGKEVCIRTWYSKPWQYVIRFKDSNMREKVAVAMERACNNNNIGYDQNQRNTLLTKARSVGYDPSKVTTKCETDCSALVTLACIYAGIPESSLFVSGNSATTTTLRSILVKTGKVEVFNTSKYLESDNYLMRGDILLREGSHVVVAIENGSKVTVASTSANNAPTTSSTINTPLKINQTKKDIQKFLNTYYKNEIKKVIGAELVVDGSIGTKSKKALAIAFQVELNKFGAKLDVDGSFGTKTATAFDKYVGTLKKGVKGNIFVTLWQCVLVGNDLDPNGVDGNFGDGCVAATNVLFNKVGLIKDSSVSGADINALL